MLSEAQKDDVKKMVCNNTSSPQHLVDVICMVITEYTKDPLKVEQQLMSIYRETHRNKTFI
jgi:hypothetical protein